MGEIPSIAPLLRGTLISEFSILLTFADFSSVAKCVLGMQLYAKTKIFMKMRQAGPPN